MFSKHLKKVRSFLKNTEKSTLAVFAVGALALAVAAPLSSTVPDDVVTLSEDGQQVQGSQGHGSAKDEQFEDKKQFEGSDFKPEQNQNNGQFNNGEFKNDKFKDQSNDGSVNINVGPPAKKFHGSPNQDGDFPDPNRQDGDFSDQRQFKNDKFKDQGNDGSVNINVGPPAKNFHGSPNQDGDFPDPNRQDSRERSSEEQTNNEEFQKNNEERMQKELEREKTRLQRDYKWTLRDLERANLQSEIDKYNDFMSRAQACTDHTCVEDVRWALDDWSFAIRDSLEAQRCTQDAERMEKEMSRNTQQLDKELSRIERDFGAEAASQYKSIVSSMKSVQTEMIGLAKQCKFDELEDLRFDKEFDVRDKMDAFWQEWGNKRFNEHEDNMCQNIQEEISRAESEKLANVPEANKTEARALLEQAKKYAADCDFAALEKLSSKAKRLGLSDDGKDAAIRGYRNIQRSDIKGFEGHEDNLENIFSELSAQDGNRVYEKLAKADRANVDRILESDDQEFTKRKLVGLKNYTDGTKANEFLKSNAELKDLLDQVAALKSEIAALKEEISRVNFHPSIAEKVKKDLEAGSLNADQLEEFKTASREAKFEDGTLPFKDFDDDTYYLDAVKKLKDEGIVKGKEEGVYDPGAATTIAEAFKIAFETAGHGYSDGDTGNASFDNHWARGYLKKAQELDIPTFGDDINQPITRAELAELIVKAKGLEYQNTDKAVFSDTTARHPYYKAIQTLNANGVFNGSDGKARPDDQLNRAEIATFMNNVLSNL